MPLEILIKCYCGSRSHGDVTSASRNPSSLPCRGLPVAASSLPGRTAEGGWRKTGTGAGVGGRGGEKRGYRKSSYFCSCTQTSAGPCPEPALPGRAVAAAVPRRSSGSVAQRHTLLARPRRCCDSSGPARCPSPPAAAPRPQQPVASPLPTRFRRAASRGMQPQFGELCPALTCPALGDPPPPSQG